jgi:hypothetical protein
MIVSIDNGLDRFVRRHLAELSINFSGCYSALGRINNDETFRAFNEDAVGYGKADSYIDAVCNLQSSNPKKQNYYC